MQFCPWYPLADARERAPAAPGVFQIRVARGLIDYPRGKSAMIHYGWGEDLRRVTSEFAQAHPETSWLCRHSQDGVAGLSPRERVQGVEGACEALLARFAQRFGSPPTLPASADSNPATD